MFYIYFFFIRATFELLSCSCSILKVILFWKVSIWSGKQNNFILPQTSRLQNFHLKLMKLVVAHIPRLHFLFLHIYDAFVWKWQWHLISHFLLDSVLQNWNFCIISISHQKVNAFFHCNAFFTKLKWRHWWRFSGHSKKTKLYNN